MSEPVGKEERDAWVAAETDLFWLSEHGALAGVAQIIKERRRQIEKLGWTVEHDDAHRDGALAVIAWASLGELHEGRESGQGDKHHDKALLRSAGALSAAEIDRLDRTT